MATFLRNIKNLNSEQVMWKEITNVSTDVNNVPEMMSVGLFYCERGETVVRHDLLASFGFI